MSNKIRLKKGQVDPKNPHATSIAGPAKLTTADASKVDIKTSKVKADANSEVYAERAEALREKNFEAIRIQGLGSNFKVLEPKDSGRKDDLVWVGTCSNCGEEVRNLKGRGLWEHETNIKYGTVSYSVDCAKAPAFDAGQKAAADSQESQIDTIDLGWISKITDRFLNRSESKEYQSSAYQFGVRCSGYTKAGTRCTAEVLPESEYSDKFCHQHYKQGFDS